MDLTIKAKAFELEALDYINERAPEMYKGKKHGFYWAVHEARLAKDTIDWKKVSRVRLENYFTGSKYEHLPLITHLTAEEEDYMELAHAMEVQFKLKRAVQKAYCIRNILKWAVMNNHVVENNCSQERDVSLEDFKKLSIDEKLLTIYKELKEIKNWYQRI